MGRAWWIQATNNLSQTLSVTGSPVINCWYQGNNLTALSPGFNNQYIESKQSGSCAFSSSYIVVWYGTAPGVYNFGIQLTNGASRFPISGTSWQQTLTTLSSRTAHLYWW